MVTVILRRERKEAAAVVEATPPAPAKPRTTSPRERARQLHGEVMGEFRSHGALVDWEARRA